MYRYIAAGLILLLPVKAHAISQQEGLLYSAIGCASLYKKLDQNEDTETLLNFIHHYSARENIQDVETGYVTRFIKLIERKWEKENDLARKNCEGITGLAAQEPKPQTYNAVTQSVVDYMYELEQKKRGQ